jgi:putative DNA primase/helicase
MHNHEIQKKFLSMVREGPGFIARRSKTDGFKQQWFANNDFVPKIASQHSTTHDIYVSLATFQSATVTREAKNAEHLCSFWVDIDRHENSIHQSDEEITIAVESFLKRTGLPRPNVWHYTGYGIHIYWALKQFLKFDEWHRIADQLQGLMDTLKVGADPITSDAARILRLPGTLNFRDPTNPVETYVNIVSEDLIETDVFEAALLKAVAKYPPQRKQITAPASESEFPVTAENIVILKSMLAAIDPDPSDCPGGTRERWRNTVWAVAAAGLGEPGYKLAREWSESGDLFDEDDFNGVWQSYDPMWAGHGKKGTGFGTLVHYAREAGYTGPLPQEADRPVQQSTPATGRLITKTAGEYEPLPIDWLVDQSIPLGAMVVIAGEPGLGKSQIAIRLAAAVTTGNGLPNGQPCSDTGSVIILANEDDAERTIRPRLEAAGADLNRVHIVEGVAREGGETDLFQLDQDIAELRIKAAELGNVRMIIIDPPGAYLGSKVDSYKDTDVRRVLAPLAKLAQDTSALILMVVHLNKRTDGSPQQRVGGSTAWTAAPRAAFMALVHPATKKRYLLPVKNNLGNDKTGFEYQILEKLLQYKTTTIKTSYVDWLGSSAFSAAELLNPPRSAKTSVVDEAKNFLEDELGSGPKSVNDLKASAKGAGLSWASIQRAKKELVIDSIKLADQWQWTLLFGDKNV